MNEACCWKTGQKKDKIKILIFSARFYLCLSIVLVGLEREMLMQMRTEYVTRAQWFEKCRIFDAPSPNNVHTKQRMITCNLKSEYGVIFVPLLAQHTQHTWHCTHLHFYCDWIWAFEFYYTYSIINVRFHWSI